MCKKYFFYFIIIYFFSCKENYDSTKIGEEYITNFVKKDGVFYKEFDLLNENNNKVYKNKFFFNNNKYIGILKSDNEISINTIVVKNNNFEIISETFTKLNDYYIATSIEKEYDLDISYRKIRVLKNDCLTEYLYVINHNFEYLSEILIVCKNKKEVIYICKKPFYIEYLNVDEKCLMEKFNKE